MWVGGYAPGASYARLFAPVGSLANQNPPPTTLRQGSIDLKTTDGYYTLSFWARGNYSTPPTVNTGSDTQPGSQVLSLNDVELTSNWKFYTATLTATALVIFVQFVINCSSTAGLLVDLDDVALRRVSCTGAANGPPRALLARTRVRAYTVGSCSSR